MQPRVAIVTDAELATYNFGEGPHGADPRPVALRLDDDFGRLRAPNARTLFAGPIC